MPRFKGKHRIVPVRELSRSFVNSVDLQLELNKLESRPARVLLVDDHPIVREGLAALINAAGDLIVCGQASGGNEALSILAECDPDVAVVDISLADRNGVDLIRDCWQPSPQLPCLALSMYDESMYAMRVLRAGGAAT